MKKQFAIVNFVLTVAVLFSMLFQSVHSIEHFAAEFAEKQCVHRQEGKYEITHKHHDTDQCFVCDFSLSSSISSDNFNLAANSADKHVPYFFAATEIFPDHKENTCLLRGPPKSIV